MAGTERMTDAQRAAKMRELNDRFRHSLRGGRLLITRGLLEAAGGAVTELLDAVRRYEAFDEGNDPYREHDFGSLTWRGERVFWKIDYYDAACRYGSPEPANPQLTTRVLTVMLACEY
ncbi:DUF3768 domain-containing protein [Paracoccus benzoatiresistens]|uniref:DUF3768 domain-containing protein n=1 Tax=Paracoccus benzoatiresistens TaxID=2997341 RepID=A0ABT4J8U0_9RHOB|nr:DUF3768 domain-containing protein [Paracoccus sp. EF6]MCZ0963508.1 DUF3768 domain-containing protein [Paracoccus sp. EF6]